LAASLPTVIRIDKALEDKASEEYHEEKVEGDLAGGLITERLNSSLTSDQKISQ
jgi:hypothetical protein